MTEVRIIKNTTPRHLRETYYKLGELKDKPLTLTIPSRLSKYRFGLMGDMLKLIISLSSQCEVKVVKLDFGISELDDFYEQEFSYPIISLFWNVAQFVSKEGKNIKSILRDKQNDFFTRMNSLEKFKGNKHIWVNTDHLSKSKGLIRLFENSNGFNDDEEKITNSVKKVLIENVLTYNKQNVNEIESVLEQIGAIIYELTKNTFEWGRTDSNAVEIPSSIRGAYLRFHINKRDKITEEYIETPLANFFNHSAISRDYLHNEHQVYYLEILVFDSGIGFIEKFQGNADEDDLTVIKKCLIKNQTSSTSNLKSKKGIGLDRILSILNKKGFLKISTDKYNVYRDLIKDEYIPINKANLEGLVLEDWDKKEFKGQIKVQGSYVSILYPFKSYRNG